MNKWNAFWMTVSLAIITLMIPMTPALAAYTSDICPGDPLSETVRCPESAVGPFMAGVTNACGNAGNCSLGDIMIVFGNVGNFVLRIIGAVVLFMYVLGGFWILAARGDSAWVSKGKKALSTATMGLVIVMVAYLGVRTLYALVTGTEPNTWVICDGTNDGAVCGVNSVCTSGACLLDDAHSISTDQLFTPVEPTQTLINP